MVREILPAFTGDVSLVQVTSDRSKLFSRGNSTEDLLHNGKSFAQFDSLAYGYRAAFILLKQYYRKYRLKTIQGIISRWAPPSDGNATSKYLTFVCHKAGVEPAEQLPFITEDPMLWFCIVSAMAQQENGQTAGTMNDVILGYVMAFENEMK